MMYNLFTKSFTPKRQQKNLNKTYKRSQRSHHYIYAIYMAFVYLYYNREVTTPNQ